MPGHIIVDNFVFELALPVFGTQTIYAKNQADTVRSYGQSGHDGGLQQRGWELNGRLTGVLPFLAVLRRWIIDNDRIIKPDVDRYNLLKNLKAVKPQSIKFPAFPFVKMDRPVIHPEVIVGTGKVPGLFYFRGIHRYHGTQIGGFSQT